MDVGSLQDMLDLRHKVPEEHLATITWQVLDGLEYLHKGMHVIHRDVKPSNLLLNSRGMVKVTDFGVSGELEDDIASQQKITWVGTIYYMSPERVRGEQYRYDSDIWSLGLTLLESLSGRYPYQEETRNQKRSLSFWELMKRIVEQEAPSQALKGVEHSLEFQDFINHCVQKEPQHRSSASKLKLHEWVSGFPSTERHQKLLDWIAGGPIKPLSPAQQGGVCNSSNVAIVTLADKPLPDKTGFSESCDMSQTISRGHNIFQRPPAAETIAFGQQKEKIDPGLFSQQTEDTISIIKKGNANVANKEDHNANHDIHHDACDFLRVRVGLVVEVLVIKIELRLIQIDLQRRQGLLSHFVQGIRVREASKTNKHQSPLPWHRHSCCAQK